MNDGHVDFRAIIMQQLRSYKGIPINEKFYI